MRSHRRLPETEPSRHWHRKFCRGGPQANGIVLDVQRWPETKQEGAYKTLRTVTPLPSVRGMQS